jgi:hypothetical protein
MTIHQHNDDAAARAQHLINAQRLSEQAYRTANRGYHILKWTLNGLAIATAALSTALCLFLSLV